MNQTKPICLTLSNFSFHFMLNQLWTHNTEHTKHKIHFLCINFCKRFFENSPSMGIFELNFCAEYKNNNNLNLFVAIYFDLFFSIENRNSHWQWKHDANDRMTHERLTSNKMRRQKTIPANIVASFSTNQNFDRCQVKKIDFLAVICLPCSRAFKFSTWKMLSNLEKLQMM